MQTVMTHKSFLGENLRDDLAFQILSQNDLHCQCQEQKTSPNTCIFPYFNFHPCIFSTKHMGQIMFPY